MSGWVNLDAKASEKVLTDWGFLVKEDKGQTKLWFHPADKEQRLIPFASPGSRRGNGKGSWRQAAQALGMSVADLVKGPTAEQRIIIGALNDVQAAGKTLFDKSAPDPLGLNKQVEKQALDRAEDAVVQLDARKRKIDALNDIQRAAYVSIEAEPLTAAEVALLIERGKTATNDALNHLIEQRLATSRISTPADGLGTGRPRLIYLAGDESTVIPPLNRPPAPAPSTATHPLWEHLATQHGTNVTGLNDADVPHWQERHDVKLHSGRAHIPVPHTHETLPDSPAPVVEEPTPEEPPVAELAAVPNIPGTDIPTVVASATTRVFEETPIVWPTGGIVIKDDAGNLYVARPLIEQGR